MYQHPLQLNIWHNCHDLPAGHTHQGENIHHHLIPPPAEIFQHITQAIKKANHQGFNFLKHHIPSVGQWLERKQQQNLQQRQKNALHMSSKQWVYQLPSPNEYPLNQQILTNALNQQLETPEGRLLIRNSLIQLLENPWNSFIKNDHDGTLWKHLLDSCKQHKIIAPFYEQKAANAMGLLHAGNFSLSISSPNKSIVKSKEWLILEALQESCGDQHHHNYWYAAGLLMEMQERSQPKPKKNSLQAGSKKRTWRQHLLSSGALIVGASILLSGGISEISEKLEKNTPQHVVTHSTISKHSNVVANKEFLDHNINIPYTEKTAIAAPNTHQHKHDGEFDLKIWGLLLISNLINPLYFTFHKHLRGIAPNIAAKTKKLAQFDWLMDYLAIGAGVLQTIISFMGSIPAGLNSLKDLAIMTASHIGFDSWIGEKIGGISGKKALTIYGKELAKGKQAPLAAKKASQTGGLWATGLSLGLTIASIAVPKAIIQLFSPPNNNAHIPAVTGITPAVKTTPLVMITASEKLEQEVRSLIYAQPAMEKRVCLFNTENGNQQIYIQAFDSEEANPNETAAAFLQQLSPLLAGQQLSIAAGTDTTGTADYNQQLQKSRSSGLWPLFNQASLDEEGIPALPTQCRVGALNRQHQQRLANDNVSDFQATQRSISFTIKR
ncbi:MAG: hypothetical protein ACOYK8_05695 [Alphaproteobacteria bacterium]